MTEMVHPDPFLVSSHLNQFRSTCRVNRSTRIKILLRRTHLHRQAKPCIISSTPLPKICKPTTFSSFARAHNLELRRLLLFPSGGKTSRTSPRICVLDFHVLLAIFLNRLWLTDTPLFRL
jgi:hypothetical protein